MLKNIALIVFILWAGFNLLLLWEANPETVPKLIIQIESAIQDAARKPGPAPRQICTEADPLGLYSEPCTLPDGLLDNLQP